MNVLVNQTYLYVFSLVLGTLQKTSNKDLTIKCFKHQIERHANMSSIQATLTASQHRWTGHIIRMNDSRLPKFYGELAKGKRLRGGQRPRYKDGV